MLKVNFHQIKEGGIELSALHTGLKCISTEFSGASKGVTVLFSVSTKLLLWVTEAILSFSIFLEAIVQLVYATCNIYCISAGFTEGQAAGRTRAPSVPVLNPMQRTQCPIHFCHLPHSEMPRFFPHVPSVASLD